MYPSKITIILFAALLTFLSWGCKKSVEGESKAWESNKRQVAETRAQFPGFGRALDEQLEKATAVYNQAEGISDEAAKIAKMNEANRMLSGGWVGQLRDVDVKRKKIRDDIISIAGLNADEADRNAIRAATKNAESTIDEVDNRMRMGALSASAAMPIVSNAINNLDGAIKSLNKIESTVKSKLKEAQKEEKAQKADEEKKNADWKCSYCGKTNMASAKECGGCGAHK